MHPALSENTFYTGYIISRDHIGDIGRKPEHEGVTLVHGHPTAIEPKRVQFLAQGKRSRLVLIHGNHEELRVRQQRLNQFPLFEP